MTEKTLSFEDARQELAAGRPCFSVRVARHHGALITREQWLDDVAGGGFIDYDGWGNELSESGEILGVGDNPEDTGWISPSEAARILPETKYILWYNR